MRFVRKLDLFFTRPLERETVRARPFVEAVVFVLEKPEPVRAQWGGEDRCAKRAQQQGKDGFHWRGVCPCDAARASWRERLRQDLLKQFQMGRTSGGVKTVDAQKIQHLRFRRLCIPC